MNPTQRLGQWRQLPPDMRRQFWMFCAGLPVISASLRALGYRRTLAWVDRWSHATVLRAPTATDIAYGQQLARAAALAGRHGLVHATCLRQALMVYGLLRRQGLSPALKLGVRRQGAMPDMHAWVSLDGIALGEPTLAHDEFPTSTGSTPR